MRRPLPPELVVLGDRLEGAAARALGERRSRRQLVLSGLPSLVIAVPLAVGLSSAVPPPAPAPPVVGPDAPAFVRGVDDLPPRNIRRPRQPSDGALLITLPELRRVLK